MVKVVTDSACDIPKRLADDLDIEVVPARILFGRRAYRDTIDLTQDQFYEMLQNTRYHPLTTQAAPLDFYRKFHSIEQMGEDILCITIPRSLSALIRSAEIAAPYIKKVKVKVVSSGGVSSFQGVQVIQAAQMARAGYSIEEIVAKLDTVRQNTKLYAMASTLDYLKRGGRISGAKYQLGTLLRVIPIVTVQDEELLNIDSVPLGNMEKAMDNVIDRLRANFSPDLPLLCLVLHAQNITGAASLTEKVMEHFTVDNLLTTQIGATIGANIGPGALGVTVAPSFSIFE